MSDEIDCFVLGGSFGSSVDVEIKKDICSVLKSPKMFGQIYFGTKKSPKNFPSEHKS